MIQVKVMTLRLDHGTGAFDGSELEKFHEGREIIDVSDHFFDHDHEPRLVLVVRYHDLRDPVESQSRRRTSKDWRSDLDEVDAKLYDEIRAWRGRRAREEGMPPFLILCNKEVAGIAANRPGSLTGLREIQGVGSAKVERWGTEILKLVSAFGGSTGNGGGDDKDGGVDGDG